MTPILTFSFEFSSCHLLPKNRLELVKTVKNLVRIFGSWKADGTTLSLYFILIKIDHKRMWFTFELVSLTISYNVCMKWEPSIHFRCRKLKIIFLVPGLVAHFNKQSRSHTNSAHFRCLKKHGELSALRIIF